MDHSHYLHVQVHVSSESARDTITAKWNGNGFRSPGKTILVAIESSSCNNAAISGGTAKLQYAQGVRFQPVGRCDQKASGSDPARAGVVSAESWTCRHPSPGSHEAWPTTTCHRRNFDTTGQDDDWSASSVHPADAKVLYRSVEARLGQGWYEASVVARRVAMAECSKRHAFRQWKAAYTVESCASQHCPKLLHVQNCYMYHNRMDLLSPERGNSSEDGRLKGPEATNNQVRSELSTSNLQQIPALPEHTEVLLNLPQYPELIQHIEAADGSTLLPRHFNDRQIVLKVEAGSVLTRPRQTSSAVVSSHQSSTASSGMGCAGDVHAFDNHGAAACETDEERQHEVTLIPTHPFSHWLPPWHWLGTVRCGWIIKIISCLVQHMHVSL